MKYIVIIQKKTEKLVENKEQYFLTTRDYKKNQHTQNTERHNQQKFGIVNKNKEDKKLKAEFENWKKQAKEKIIKLKHGELTEDDVYEWLQKNK